MRFDWLTFVAQVVNFLILVWLLKRFLFGRIAGAMERREQRITARLAEAAEQRREAAEEGRKFRQLEQELAQRRAEIMDHARDEAAEQRSELLADARRQVDREEARWRKGLRQEKGAFLRDLRRRTADEVLDLCRRVLADLVGEGLEERVAGRLAERLGDLDEDSRQRLEEALVEADGRVLVESAFAVVEPRRQEIRRALDGLGQVRSLEWLEKPDLGLGFQVMAGGWQLGWSLEGYLDALQERVGELLDESQTTAEVSP